MSIVIRRHRLVRRVAGTGHEERGSGTILALSLIGVLAVVFLASATLLATTLAASRAATAADLAALSAARLVADGASEGSGCALARAVAIRHQAVLTGCRAASDGSVTVRCVAPLKHPLPGLPKQASSESRAGPTP